jgi:hypothetical protein
MFKRQPTSTDPADASVHSRRRAAADSAWLAQDRVRSTLGSGFQAAARTIRQGSEQVADTAQEKVVWPLEDRAATMGAPARRISFGMVVVLAAAVGVAGLIWAAPDKPDGVTATEVAVTSAPPVRTPAPAPKSEPTLHGAAPVFKPATKTAGGKVDPAKAIVSSAPAGSSSTDASSSQASSSTASSAAAKTDSVDGPPAGPQAIAVATDFAGAFVLYETGDDDADVRQAFGRTTTPALARSLLRRPPRLPADVEVPKAKVVNVVPAPSHGGVYPVSVSLLRVGLTSELRLEMEQLKGDGWRVTNVLG